MERNRKTLTASDKREITTSNTTKVLGIHFVLNSRFTYNIKIFQQAKETVMKSELEGEAPSC